MKKIVLFTVFISLSFYGFSQDVKYGVRGGYNISNLDFDNPYAIENKHRNSMYFGAFATIGLNKTLSLMPEFQFSAEGANEEKINLDYLQVPILVRFRISEKFHAGIGPQVGLKINKFEDGIRNFAYSGVAAVEYKINLMLFADVRYTYGFSNVFDEPLGITARNRNIQLGVGYKF
ncbi:porin family protein [Algibacter sp. L4_22]|uniref:porin family protein n=1 Tax=Algibacter sp. L4_22 TaxID=2942477 RepID=UPI00201B60C4|nr:porin family protein [Algibacter sp. L4_22]MCL5128070.1 porin family protein [Algibacter sp. L4_22]